MRLLTWCIAVLGALVQLMYVQSLEAQNAAASLVGTAYDSVSGKPLSGATVRIIGRAGLAVSDKKGKFHFDSLLPGKYSLVMEHAKLDSMGLAEVVVVTELAENRKEAKVTMSIPSFGTMWKRACGSAEVPVDRGLMHGAIRSPVGEQGVFGARVAISWTDVSVGAAKKLKQTKFTLETETDTTGVYVACGIPVDVPLQIVAGLDSASQIVIDLQSQNSRVLRRDVMLGAPDASSAADSAAAGVSGGTGTVRGKVVNVTGAPMANVRIGVDGVEITRTNSLGEFVANNVRAGTRTVAFVSIGSEPVTKLVDVPVEGVVTTSASMTRATVLDEFVVRGQRVARLVRDYEERKRAGFGSFKDSTEIMRYPSLESALRMSRGVKIDSRTHAIYLPSLGGYCLAHLFIDRRRADQDELLMRFPVDIAWIEVYPRWYDVPIDFQPATCGTVVVFTKYAVAG